MITVRHVDKWFGRTRAVRDLSFDVRPGVVTGFLGPNGAGKSTTLRLMLELDRGGGETLFDGVRFHHLERPLRQVGAVLEAGVVHPGRSARNHLRMLAAAAGIGAARVDEVLGTVGLADVAGRPPGSFSLGMGRRLALAGALLVPDAEPAVIGELAARHGIVLHELSERSASLEQAFLEATGEATEYRAEPAAPAPGPPSGRHGARS